MAWTKEQQLAIDKEGTSIIVSAGAGSGKTAVLTERVKRKLQSGIHIHQLLVLTFTKAAAMEMKERIRHAIKDDPSLKEELNYLDAAYITTFDSYSLSIVKKYHDVLNITNQVKICDDTVLKAKTKDFLEEIITSYMEKEDSRMISFLEKFCMKEDKILVESLLFIYQSLSMRYDMIDYLQSYMENTYQDDYLEAFKLEYISFLLKEKEKVDEYLEELSNYVDATYLEDLDDSLSHLRRAKTYEDIKEALEVKLKRLPNNSDPLAKKNKDKISKTIKSLQQLCPYQNEKEIIDTLYSTKEMASLFVDVLLELTKKIEQEKKENDLYDFTTIAKMAIKILESRSDIQEEIKNSFQEILIDEYQDTSDLQELFISYIANNNVYMVGDIKQSIYRFRNANPYIFKNKYDCYALGNGGMKIDLVKNFRSRNEVLENINLMFNLLMSDDLGGAKYKLEHQMVFGNMDYETNGKVSTSSNMEVLNYKREKDYPYSKEEIEIFITACDILEKMKMNYQVFDKKTKALRPLRYSDIVILIDRGTNFDLYKKIFEYLAIPLSIEKDDEITKSIDVKILKNIIELVYAVKNKQFDDTFRYCYTSIARSFLINESDDVIFKHLTDGTIYESSVYQKVCEIENEVDHLSLREALDLIYEVFDYQNQLVLVGNVIEATVRMDYLRNLGSSFEQFGYTLFDFLKHLDVIFNEKYQIKFSSTKFSLDSVKIMTIHKSKGLEFPLCYFPLLSTKFNESDVKKPIFYDKHFGFIFPPMVEGFDKTILKLLYQKRYYQEEISEKLRLFYVALTRCREKMILITSLEDDEEETLLEDVVSTDVRLSYRSFRDFLVSIKGALTPYLKNISIEQLPLTKSYASLGKKPLMDLEIDATPFVVEELTLEKGKELQRQTFSKKGRDLFTKEEKRSMELGNQFHQILEWLDMKNPDFSSIDDEWMKKKIRAFLGQELIKEHLNDKFYHEYEFMLKNKEGIVHGKIDLLIQCKNHLVVIDYKLKHTLDDAYDKQLQGYQIYLEQKFHLPVKLYLYSILDEKFIEKEKVLN